MKKSILFTIVLMIISANSTAAEVFAGAYGVAEDEGAVVDYVSNDAGIIFGVEGRYWAADVSLGLANKADKNAFLRGVLPIGNFKYSLGVGQYTEYGTLTDLSGNWDAQSISDSETNYAGTIHIEHKTGVYFRYIVTDYESTFRFCETSLTGVVLDSKEVSVDETREKFILGYKVNF